MDDPKTRQESMSLQQTVSKGRSQAIQWLGLDKKPSGRVLTYLSDKGYDRDTARMIINELKQDDYINDELLARQVVKRRTGRRAESRSALVHRMARLGLDAGAIDTAITSAQSDYDAATALIEARFRQSIDLVRAGERNALFKRIFMFLQRRGFGRELTLRVMADIGLEIDKFV